MSPREALEAVGLASLDGVTSDGLRRAYLRKLREHPPERDPDGFARLRAAFELLRGAVGARDAVSAGRARIVVVPARPDQGAAERAIVVPAALIEPPPIEPPSPEPPPTPVIAPRPAAPMSLRELVPRLLSLLLAGQVDEAVELEARWRADGGDDCRVIGPAEAARWVFVRELVGVAPDLPEGVRHPLALAVREGDFRGARDVLADFRRGNFTPAAIADGVLERRAPSLHAQVRGCLTPPPRTDRIVRKRTGTRGFAWLGALVMVALIRAMWSTSTSTSRSTSTPPLPSTYTRYDPDQQRTMAEAESALAAIEADPSAPLSPATQKYLPPDASPAPVEDPSIGDARAQCLQIEDPSHPASSAQRAAASAMRAALPRSCNARRMALRELVRAAPLRDRDARALSAAAIRQIHDDVDALCPQEPAK